MNEMEEGGDSRVTDQ